MNMKKYFLSFIFVLTIVGLTAFTSNEVSAQDVDGIPVTVSYPDPIPTGTTYNEVFPDDDFAKCVASDVFEQPTDEISAIDIGYIDTVYCGGTYLDPINLSSIVGIEYLYNLEELNIQWAPLLTDISAIANLTSITSIYITNTSISDISAIANLNNLKSFTVRDSLVSDISVFANNSYPELSRLNLTSNEIVDVSPLSTTSMPMLAYLYMEDNHIANINYDFNFPSLITMYASGQTIDIGTVYGNSILGPISSGSHPFIGSDGTVSYSRLSPYGGSYDASTNIIYLGTNYGTTPIDFSDGSYSGSITFTRGDAVPTITQPGDTTITKGITLDILENVTAKDLEDGDLTPGIVTSNPDGFKGDGTDVPGTYTITYTVTDSFGNIVSETRVITVVDAIVPPVDPVTPVDPATPVDPTTPVDPATPVDPDTSVEPTVTETGTTASVASTGLTQLTFIIGALVIVIATYGIIRFKRK